MWSFEFMCLYICVVSVKPCQVWGIGVKGVSKIFLINFVVALGWTPGWGANMSKDVYTHIYYSFLNFKCV